MDVLTDALATYRLTRLAQQDSITEPLRKPVLDYLHVHRHTRLQELADCPWCLSVWAGFGVVALRRAAPRVWGVIAKALAFSAVTGLITQASDRLDT